MINPYEPPVSESAAFAYPMSDKIKFVTIATVENATHAVLLKNVLEVEGIQAIVTDGFIGDMLWTLQTATGGIKVQVKEQDVEKAIAVLENKDPLLTNDDQWMEDISQENKMEDEDSSIDEDEHVENETDKMIQRSYLAALFGLAFIPIQLYSIWLLYKVAFLTDENINPKYKNKMLISVILNFTAIRLAFRLYWVLSSGHLGYLDSEGYALFFLWLALPSPQLMG